MSTPDDWPEVVTVDEIAAWLRVSPMSIYRMIHSGELPARKVGRKAYRIFREDARRLMPLPPGQS